MEVSELKDLADRLHSLDCGLNHTDYCGWFYDFQAKDPWERFSHKEYLKKIVKCPEIYKNYIEAKEVLLSKLKEMDGSNEQ